MGIQSESSWAIAGNRAVDSPAPGNKVQQEVTARTWGISWNFMTEFMHSSDPLRESWEDFTKAACSKQEFI